MIERGHHDLGGRLAGKVERDEHDYQPWERRIDAMAVLLGAKKLLTVDQRRKNIEKLPPAMYDSLSYYERWLMSLAQSLIERGLITTPELSRKMLEVGARGFHDMGGLPAGKVQYDEHVTTPAAIEEAIAEAGYNATSSPPRAMTEGQM